MAVILVNNGVPLGSVLGLVHPDTQLYLSVNPDNAQLQECLKDVNIWTTQNFLFLNADKTEVIVLIESDWKQSITFSM